MTNIGTVVIFTAYNLHQVADRYTYAYDFDTQTYQVTAVGSDSRDTLVGAGATEWLAHELIDVSSCDGTTLIRFEKQVDYPYFKVVKDFNSPSCNPDPNADDLEITSVLVTDSSGANAADGAVMVSCSTTATPAKVELFNFNYEIQGYVANPDATINGLLPGPYTLHAKDAAGFSLNQSFEISYVKVFDYAPKWRIEFTSRKRNNRQLTKRVDILQRGFTGQVTVVSEDDDTKYGTNPVQTNRTLEGGFTGSYMSQNCVVTIQNKHADQWEEIRTADDQKYLLRHYEYENENWSLDGQYYVTADLYSSGYFNPNGFTSITATNRIKDLGNADFSLLGVHDLITILNHCLLKTGLNQPIRCASNLYEINHLKGATDDPFKQSFIDCASYYDEESKPFSCLKVIQRILIPKHAFVCSHGGYFYIFRFDELENETINYREFDTVASFVSNGVIDDHIKDFTLANADGRWTSNVTVANAPNFRKVMITRSLNNRASLIAPFISKYLNDQNPTTGVKGLTGVLAGETGSWSLIEHEKDHFDLSFDFVDGQGGKAYIMQTGKIEYSREDSIELDIEFFLTPPRNSLGYNEPLYCILRWQLQVGQYYLQQDETWTNSPAVNERFISEYDKYSSFKVQAPMPDEEGRTDDYIFRLYDVDPRFSHIQTPTEQGMILAVRDVDATNLEYGHRLVAEANILWYYYELQDSIENENGVSIIKPTTGGANKRWKIQKIQTVLRGSKFYLREIFLQTKPLGKEREEQLLEETTINSNNTVDLSKEIFHFDVPKEINNSEQVVINYLRRADGTPTETWAENGEAYKRLDLVLALSYASVSVKGANRLNGSFWYNRPLRPFDLIREVTDHNRIYFPLRLTSDHGQLTHTGELLEIASDIVTEGPGEYNTDFNDDFA